MDKLLRTIISAIEDKKGKDIVSIDLSGFDGAIASSFVICNADSTAQVEAFFAGKYTGPVDSDPAFTWDSETYNQKGEDLRVLIRDARVKFITGAIDEADAPATRHEYEL